MPIADIWSQLFNLLTFMIFILFFNRIMVMQVMFKLERSANLLEGMSSKAERIVLKKINKRPDKKLRQTINNFLEFFVIPPVSIDPYGIMKKFEHIVDLEKYRFKYFIKQVAPELGSEEQSNLMMGMSGAISLHELAKIVRHFVELIKKTKSYNLALVIQMQLPFIERIGKALLRGTEALSNGWPLGDTIGAYVAGNFIGDSKVTEGDEETVVCRKRHKKRDIIVIKAKGPGSRTGNPGRVLEKISKRERIAKIITIDAAAKLEGEKTGIVAEGIGVAIGGIGVEKSHVEDIAVKKNIPLDSIIIKMGEEEAIMPMKKSILDSVPKVMGILNETIERTTEKGKIIVVGVGNTSGVGNDKKGVEEARKTVKKIIRKMKIREKKGKKRFRFELPFSF